MSTGDLEIIALTQRRENSEQRMARPRRKTMPRWFVIVYYITLSIVAISLTMSSKGTKLWNDGKIDESELLSLLVHYSAVLIAFFVVHNSDPGYISSDAMRRVCEEDGVSMQGTGMNREREETEISEVRNSSSQLVSDVEMISIVSQSTESSSTKTRNTIKMSRRNTVKNDDDENLGHDDTDNLSTLENGFDSAWTSHTRRKVCIHCEIAPPLRSHHCKICDKCVATFDHHCGFIGTCIGERNHCRFYWFLLIQFIGFLKCCSIISTSPLSVTCWLNMPCRKMLHANIMYWDILVVVAAKCYVYMLTFLASTMVALHSWLMLTNGTTFELEKREHIEYLRGVELCDVPFSNGLPANLRMFCCMRDTIVGICKKSRNEWKPIVWKPVGNIVRDSEDWMNHPWQNKYWTCC